ncbi:MAG TPA: serine hydrolase domain-containing protein [Chitinophagaceae bacterium]|jgi:CubicO group peptidase (beta-lactamase class C family)
MKTSILPAIVLFVSCLVLPQVTIFANDPDKIDSLLSSVYLNDQPGASIAVMQQGKIVFKKSYGVVNIDAKEKITSSTNFNIASLTKQFTALAVLQLAEKNKLSLNDNLTMFFPEMNKKVANVITVKQLLTHSSGIIDHYGYVNTNQMHHAHNKDVFDAIKNIDSTYFVPGTQFRYSNTAYCLLALIIEKLSGLSYNTYLEKNIFQPAGMNHTSVWNEQSGIISPATGYEWNSTQNKFQKSGADEHIFFSTEGDGGIYTSVNDYLKWFSALQSTKVFSRSITDKARSLQYVIDNGKTLGYGYGWFIDESNPLKYVYHSGSNGGFRTFSFTIPDKNYLVLIFSNRADIDPEELVLKINQILGSTDKPFTKIEVLTS